MHRPDTHELRRAFGRFTTGVAVITTRATDGRPVGLTANSLVPLSLEPPLLAWSLARRSGSLGTFLAAPWFAVNVLAHDQEDLSRRFAGPAGERFADLDWRSGLGGCPLLERRRELAERVVGARAVDRGRPAVHEERHADRLGRFLASSASTCRSLGVRCDAAVAPFDHGDREGDELLRLHVERTGGERRLVELAEALVDVGDRMPQLAVQRVQPVEDGLAELVVTHDVTIPTGVSIRVTSEQTNRPRCGADRVVRGGRGRRAGRRSSW